MIIATHKKIAKEVYKRLSKGERQRLHKKSFISGSYFPDINFKHSTKQHSFEKTGKIVKKMISVVSEGRLSRKSLSHKLGIICHYLSDYCCAYHSHNVYSKKSLVEHLKYEYRLDKKFDSVVKVLGKVAPFNIQPGEFEQHIEGLIAGKMQETPQSESDILNAVSISYLYISAIMRVCFAEQRDCA